MIDMKLSNGVMASLALEKIRQQGRESRRKIAETLLLIKKGWLESPEVLGCVGEIFEMNLLHDIRQIPASTPAPARCTCGALMIMHRGNLFCSGECDQV